MDQIYFSINSGALTQVFIWYKYKNIDCTFLFLLFNLCVECTMLLMELGEIVMCGENYVGEGNCGNSHLFAYIHPRTND